MRKAKCQALISENPRTLQAEMALGFREPKGASGGSCLVNVFNIATAWSTSSRISVGDMTRS